MSLLNIGRGVAILMAGWLVLSCSGKEQGLYQAPEFKVSENRVFELSPQEINVQLTRGFFHYRDRYIVVGLYDMEYFVQVFDEQMNLLTACVRRGRGPREIYTCKSPHLNVKAGELSLYDYMMKKMVVVDLDKVEQLGEDAVWDVDIDNLPLLRAECAYLIQGNYLIENRFSGSDAADGLSRFTYLSAEDGSWLADCDASPAVGPTEGLMLYAFPNVSFSADDSSWAIGACNGSILEHFSLKDNTITADWTKYFYPSDMESHLNDICHSETPLGFSDICLTDDAVYAIVEFEKPNSYLCSEDFAGDIYMDVAIFNLDGSPRKIIHTDCRMNEILVEGETLYAIVSTVEGELHLARFKL